MSAAADASSPITPAQIPPLYWLWLVGLVWTSVGVNLLSFGMVWMATSHSASLAGLVLVATAGPRVTLTLVGGAVADRLGPIRVMVAADSMMTVLTAAAAATALFVGPHPALLLSAAFVLGVADAFYQPAAGSVPKMVVAQDGLPRAMAARQVVIYFASVLGPALGGVVVSAQGLPLSFGLGAAGFSGMLLILLLVRRRVWINTDDAAAGGSHVLGQIGAGLALVWRSGLLRGVFMMTAAFAFFVLPVTVMLVPLTARSHGWSAQIAGTASGSFSAGMMALALFVMCRSGFHRAGLAAIAGMVVTGIGMMGLACAPIPWLAVGSALVAGLGAGLFSTHIGPLFVAAAPVDYIARVQSVMILAQAGPMMVAGPVIGGLADRIPVSVVILLWAAGTAVVALGALLSRPLRTARRPQQR